MVFYQKVILDHLNVSVSSYRRKRRLNPVKGGRGQLNPLASGLSTVVCLRPNVETGRICLLRIREVSSCHLYQQGLTSLVYEIFKRTLRGYTCVQFPQGRCTHRHTQTSGHILNVHSVIVQFRVYIQKKCAILFPVVGLRGR